MTLIARIAFSLKNFIARLWYMPGRDFFSARHVMKIGRLSVGILLPLAAIAVVGMMFVSHDAHSSGQKLSNADCMSCHDESEHEGNQLYDSLLGGSVHSGFSCIQCHSTIQQLPHPDSLPRANCGQCHDDVVADYTKHGGAAYPASKDIPACSDCHGRHHILSSQDSSSQTSRNHLAATCGKCHENVDLVKKHDIPFGAAVAVFESSVHGTALAHGSEKAPICTDCHGADGNPHRILLPGDPASSINHFAIPKTCGKCHAQEAEEYAKGIHGKLVARGETGAPVCTSCHGEHGIISPKDPRSPVSPARIAEATCSPCHTAASLNDRYRLPSGQLTTWVDSYHGLKSEQGDIAVANCASCHGAHMILPQSDTLSSINARNLSKTCGNCHPGITSTVASTTIHGTPGVSSTPFAGTVRLIYIITIILVVGMMLFHGVIDYRHQVRLLRSPPQVTRMTRHELLQHWALMITFIVLVITGFALRFSDAWWAVLLFGHEGGHPLRGTIHRYTAIVFIATSGWHLYYLFTPRGKQFIRDIWLKWSDFGDFLRMIRFNLGANISRPTFGRFGYVEKFEYWALVWGTVVMAVTGLLLWFDNAVTRVLPKSFLDVILVIHFYEAILASLAILVWHLYSTIFSPSVYPMNPSWLTGSMPAAMYYHEHGGESNQQMNESVPQPSDVSTGIDRADDGGVNPGPPLPPSDKIE